MSLLYFKQAWQLLRQEKLFSSIYILGTGLSISMVMVLTIIYYVKIADIYPETNRSRMLILKNGQVKRPDGSSATSSLSLTMLQTCLADLKTAEAVSIVYTDRREDYVQPPGSKEQLPVTVKYVDPNYWKVFDFAFQSGKPFTAADMQSGIRTVVIAQSLALRLFGTTEARGQDVNINFVPYRVCGVVKDVSFAADKTYALLWMPYLSADGYEENWEGNPNKEALGSFKAYVLAPSAGKVEEVKAEIDERIRRYTSSLADAEFTLNGQPDRQWQTIFRYHGGQTIDWTKLLLTLGLIYLVFLLIPAVSLSGMTDSRMERRLAEMGVRRAFGAPVYRLMEQVIAENLLFTLLGGLVGLLFSYLLVVCCGNWILQLGEIFSEVLPEGVDVEFSASMLMNYTVFSVALGVCLVLNLASAIIPAWRASRQQIIYSLNTK